MATVELIPATDQDGSELWQHAECAGVTALSRVTHLTDGDVPDPEAECVMCGEAGEWFPLYRPANAGEVALIERLDRKRDEAVRRAQLALAEALK